LSDISRGLIVRIFIILVGCGLFSYFMRDISFEYSDILQFIFFAALVCMAEFFDITLPQGGSISVSPAIILAALLLLPLSNILVAAVVGIIITALIRRKMVEMGGILFPIAVTSITICLSGTIFYLLFYLTRGRPYQAAPGELGLFRDFLPLIALCLSYFLIDVGLDQLLHSLKRRTLFLSAFIGGTRLLGPIYAALFSVGILMALLFWEIHYWIAPLFFIPLLVTRHSFKLYLDIRRAYYNTIRALASAAETQYPQNCGHAQRVASYAINIAREMGIHGRKLELVGYAALLHDLGKIGVDEDSLDSVLETTSQDGEPPHAVVGAEILEQVEFLRNASNIVRKHHRAFDGERRSEADHPIAARIINVASYYDKLTHAEKPEKRLTPNQAVTRIRKQQGFRFDPKVVRALTNILQRRGKLLSFA